MATVQSWRKAYGAIKDTTKLDLLQINSSYADLDVAIVKATNHVECQPKERHLRKKANVRVWVAHDNDVFDVCWIKEYTHILTASADQTIMIWNNAEEQKSLRVLGRHITTVKSMAPHPTNTDIVVSGSRDGSFALWDLRCTHSSRSTHEEIFIS